MNAVYHIASEGATVAREMWAQIDEAPGGGQGSLVLRLLEILGELFVLFNVANRR